MPAIPLVAAGIGAAVSLKGQSDAKKAASQAAEAAKNNQINIPQVSQMATDQALKNLQLSQQVEQQYAPQNAQLRTESVQALLKQLGVNPTEDIQKQLEAQFGNPTSTYGGSITDSLRTAAGGSPIAGQIASSQGASPVSAVNANSGLLQDAVTRAREDLALGGNLPLDVRNLVARTAAGKSMGATGNLGAGRDINARDLGLTSLQIAQQRLNNAQSLGQADLGANQFNSQLGLNAAMTNAQMLQQNNQYNTGQRNSALQFDSGQAQQNSQFNTGQYNSGAQFDAAQRQQANQFGQGNQLNIAQLLSQLTGNDFSRQLAAAQFGQSIQTPTVGLDPSAIANLAVGNSNMAGNAAQNAAAIKASGAQGLGQLGGNLVGYGLSAYQNRAPQVSTNTYYPTYNNPTMASANGVPPSQITASYGF